MSDLEAARQHLRMAEVDLRGLRRTVELGGFDDRHVGFHAQQVLEKTVKAWLAAVVGAFPRTHSLADLFGLLRDAGVEVGGWASLIEYSPFAVERRYGDPLDEANELPLDQAAALADAEALFAHVSHIVAALP